MFIITDPTLLFFVVAINIQAFVIARDKFLYAFVMDLHSHSIYSLLDGILYFFFTFKVPATQKFLQCWEQVKITWDQVWTTCWMLEC